MKYKLLAVGLSVLLATGCQTTHRDATTGEIETNSQTKGTVIGAIGGAVLGGIVGGEKGAVIGAGIGGLTGNAYGSSLDKQEARLRSKLVGRGVQIKRNHENGELKLILPGNITFAKNSATISDDAKDTLRYVALSLSENPELSLQINGHTDSTGRFETNEALSGLRAQSVADYLIMHGVRNHIRIAGYGESQPIASNMTSAGQAQNRRVEIILY